MTDEWGLIGKKGINMSNVIISHYPSNKPQRNKEEIVKKIEEKYIWMFNVKQLKQKSIEWLETKKYHISASEVAVALGLSKYRSPDTLFKLKCNILPAIPTTDAMLHGINFESEAAQKFVDFIGQEMFGFGFLEDQTYKFLGVSPDGFLADGTVVEIKAPGSRRVWDNYTEEDIMRYYPDYYHQVQMQAYVMKANRIILVQYGVAPNPYHTVDNPVIAITEIKIDLMWIHRYAPKLTELWEKIELYRSNNPSWESQKKEEENESY